MARLAMKLSHSSKTSNKKALSRQYSEKGFFNFFYKILKMKVVLFVVL